MSPHPAQTTLVSASRQRSTEVCAVAKVAGRPVWSLEASNGTTMVWFDGDYRYELFGRSYVALAALQKMVRDLVPLSELGAPPR